MHALRFSTLGFLCGENSGVTQAGFMPGLVLLQVLPDV